MKSISEEFYSLLEDIPWIPHHMYEDWYSRDEIKKEKLISAVDNEKIIFCIKEGYRLFKPNALICRDYGGGQPLYEYKNKNYHRRELISEYIFWGRHHFVGELMLEGKSFLAWLKEHYPLEEKEKSTPQKIETVSSSIPHTQGFTFPTVHEYEPPLLKIAVECWKALYEDAGPDGKKIRKPQIEKWLQENHAELSANSRKTIVTVVNPFKTGGATPSE